MKKATFIGTLIASWAAAAACGAGASYVGNDNQVLAIIFAGLATDLLGLPFLVKWLVNSWPANAQPIVVPGAQQLAQTLQKR